MFARSCHHTNCSSCQRQVGKKPNKHTTNIVFDQNVFYLQHLLSSLYPFTFVVLHKIKDVQICWAV